MKKTRSTTKKFHIVKRNGIISNYFNEGGVKEYWNFKFDNEDYKNGREIGWTNILAHDITNWDDEWIDKYNQIEDKTTRTEDEWTKKRLNKFLNFSKSKYIIEEIDRKYLIDVFEKVIFSYGDVTSEYENIYNKKILTRKTDPIQVKNYINFKLHNTCNKDFYKDHIKYLENVKCALKKTNFLYLLEVENLLTSEPLQVKTLLINNEQTTVMIFQISPEKMIFIPFVYEEIEDHVLKDERFRNEIRRLFYTNIDLFGFIHLDHSKFKEIIKQSWKSPVFLYVKNENEISSFYKNIIENINIHKPLIKLVQTSMPKDTIALLASMYIMSQDILLATSDEEESIISENKIEKIGESTGYILRPCGKECEWPKRTLLKFKINDKILIQTISITKDYKNIVFYEKTNGIWKEPWGTTLKVLEEFK